jgi:hypothetical protein
MASPESSLKSLAFIHNSALPHPLGVLSTAISEWIKKVCIQPNVPLDYDVTVIDLADYDLQSPESSDRSHNLIATQTVSTSRPTSNLKSQATWEEEINKHCGLILLFPYHIWSHCNPLKNALSPPLLQPGHVARKPILLLGFGKEEVDCNRRMKRKSFNMLKGFCEQRGMKVIGVEVEQWAKEDQQIGLEFPQFVIYADYWEAWIAGGPNGCLGGQQNEAFENLGWNRAQTGVMTMVDMLAGRAKRKK